MRRSDLALIAQTRAELADGRVRAAREAAGVMQAEIAAVLGVTPAAVCLWEAGKRIPSTSHALAYGKLLRELGQRAA